MSISLPGALVVFLTAQGATCPKDKAIILRETRRRRRSSSLYHQFQRCCLSERTTRSLSAGTPLGQGPVTHREPRRGADRRQLDRRASSRSQPGRRHSPGRRGFTWGSRPGEAACPVLGLVLGAPSEPRKRRCDPPYQILISDQIRIKGM